MITIKQLIANFQKNNDDVNEVIVLISDYLDNLERLLMTSMSQKKVKTSKVRKRLVCHVILQEA